MKLITALLSVFLVLPAFANESALNMSFDCGGLIQVGEETKEYTEFTINYSDFVSGQGFENETLSFTMPEITDVNLTDVREESEENKDCIQLDELSLQTNGDFEYFKFEYSQTCGDDINLHTNIISYCSKN